MVQLLLYCVLKPQVERAAEAMLKFGRKKKRVSNVILLTPVLIVCRRMNKMYRVVPVQY